MADSDSLQHMCYQQGEFLQADDFTLEQAYFQNQFRGLFSYYFSPGIAGSPQTLKPQTVYQLFRGAKALSVPQTSTPPVSFLLQLISPGPPPVSQDPNYISVGAGLAIDPMANQIVLLSGTVVDKSYFANVQGNTAYLTIAYGETTSSANSNVIVQQPVFSVVEPPAAYNSININALYLATVTLEDKAIVGVIIDPTLRQYSQPYVLVSEKTQERSQVLSKEYDAELASMKKKLAQMESVLKSIEKLRQSQ